MPPVWASQYCVLGQGSGWPRVQLALAPTGGRHVPIVAPVLSHTSPGSHSRPLGSQLSPCFLTYTVAKLTHARPVPGSKQTSPGLHLGSVSLHGLPS